MTRWTTEYEALEQITIICRDHRHSTADLTAALKEIRKIAANAPPHNHSQPEGESVLLPCPFCGGEAGYFASQQAVFRAEWVGHVYHCTQCQGRVQNTDRQTAQAMWNRRAQCGVQTGDAELWARETDAEFARLTGIIFDLYKPLSELVVAYQDADSPAMQDTIKRARAALAPASAMRVGGISLAEPEPPTTTLTSTEQP